MSEETFQLDATVENEEDPFVTATYYNFAPPVPDVGDEIVLPTNQDAEDGQPTEFARFEVVRRSWEYFDGFFRSDSWRPDIRMKSAAVHLIVRRTGDFP